jgi:mycofactocin precursor
MDERTTTARDEDVADETVVVDDLLVEEVSIDGMCGVY